ncbi:hypothetical protein ACHAXR_010729 [Thalassiosira sp. AJA248-18]
MTTMDYDNGSMFIDDADDAGGRRRRRRRGGGRCRLLGYSFRYDSPCAILLGLASIGTLGVFLGLILPSSSSTTAATTSSSSSSSSINDGNNTIAANWDTISNILGYTYFLSWTLSFYPQIITNWKFPNKARHGVSLDFVVWNVVGFACYAIYTTSFRYSDVVRKEYAERFGSSDDDDTGNDVLGNVTGSLVNFFLSDLLSEGKIANNIDGADISIIEIPNPFNWTNWTWGGDNNSTSDNDSSSSNDTTGNEGSNTTNSGDAVAVPQVKVNDVAFAWHALLLTIITFVQIIWWSERSSDNSDRNNEGHVVIEGRENGGVVVGDPEESPRNDSLPSLSVEEEWVGINSLNNHGNPLEQRMDNSNTVEDCQLERQANQTSNIPTQSILPPPSHSQIHWTQRISSTTKCLILLLLSMCVVGAIMVACDVNIGYWGGGDQWQWIDYLYFLSFVKVGVSVVKYIPQVALNYRRKSTSGWQIWNILLDFSGGTLSIVQLVGDSLAEARAQGLPHSWTGIIGNPAKFGLGLVSVFCDVIFMFQHYVLYRHSSSRHLHNERGEISNDYETPLLHDE